MNYQELCNIGSASFAADRMGWQSIKMSVTESQVELFILTWLFTKVFLEKNNKGEKSSYIMKNWCFCQISFTLSDVYLFHTEEKARSL